MLGVPAGRGESRHGPGREVSPGDTPTVALGPHPVVSPEPDIGNSIRYAGVPGRFVPVSTAKRVRGKRYVDERAHDRPAGRRGVWLQMTEDDGDDETDDEYRHLTDVEDGAGCTEIWERLSENRDGE